MHKIDIQKDMKGLYACSSQECSKVNVPALNFLMIDGEGNPNTSPAYADAVQALFSVSYAAKFIVKKSSIAVDFSVMPLEGLWWADDMEDFVLGRRDSWKWTLMILQPEYVTADVLGQAMAQVERKKGLASVSDLRLEVFHEGPAAQVTHVGPYDQETPTIVRLHQFVAQQNGVLTGRHHEIYLSDPRRTAPEKLKTIIRQPFLQKDWPA